MARPPQQNQNGLQQIAAATAAKANRPVHDFDVPDELREEIALELTETMINPSVVSLRALTPGEERHAQKRAGQDPMQIVMEMIAASLVSVEEGGIVTTTDTPASGVALLNRMHPKLRSLVGEAFAKVHRATEEQQQGFLKSRRVRVG